MIPLSATHLQAHSTTSPTQCTRDKQQHCRSLDIHSGPETLSRTSDTDCLHYTGRRLSKENFFMGCWWSKSSFKLFLFIQLYKHVNRQQKFENRLALLIMYVQTELINAHINMYFIN